MIDLPRSALPFFIRLKWFNAHIANIWSPLLSRFIWAMCVCVCVCLGRWGCEEHLFDLLIFLTFRRFALLFVNRFPIVQSPAKMLPWVWIKFMQKIINLLFVSYKTYVLIFRILLLVWRWLVSTPPWSVDRRPDCRQPKRPTAKDSFAACKSWFLINFILSWLKTINTKKSTQLWIHFKRKCSRLSWRKIDMKSEQLDKISSAKWFSSSRKWWTTFYTFQLSSLMILQRFLMIFLAWWGFRVCAYICVCVCVIREGGGGISGFPAVSFGIFCLANGPSLVFSFTFCFNWLSCVWTRSHLFLSSWFANLSRPILSSLH